MFHVEQDNAEENVSRETFSFVQVVRWQQKDGGNVF